MVESARCITCREPLDEKGRCANCERQARDRKPHDDLALEERLRLLREQVFKERSESAPAEPRSRLWKRKQKELEQARKDAEAREEETTPSAEAPAAEPDAGESGAEAPNAGESGGEPSGQPSKVASEDEAGTTSAPAPEKGSTAAEPGGKKAARSSTASPDSKSSRSQPSSPKAYGAGGSGSGIRARQHDVTDPRHGSEAVDELLEHRRRGLGKIIGLAGPPMHGKTELAQRIRQRYAERPGVDLRYDKTTRGEVNIYYVPGRREHHVVIDTAGEDFEALGDYDRDLPALVRRFLWPVLQELDGLILLMALPIIWDGWNPDPESGVDRRTEPDERAEIGMREAARRMVDSHRMLLKYAMVARDLKRLKKAMPQLGLDAREAPTRNQVDDAFQTARRLEIPIAIGFSKADLYAPEGRSGLFTPDLPRRTAGASGDRAAPPLNPRYTDPLALGYLHFPELFEFLLERTRYFKFDFVQALEDRSRQPNPKMAEVIDTDASRETLLGAEGLVEFVTRHPWRIPGIDTARALKLDRRLAPDRWDRSLLRRLHDRGDGRGAKGAP